MSSPNCVSGILDYVDKMGRSPPPVVDENDDADSHSLRHRLVERWFQDRFFLPRPYRSTSIDYDGDDTIRNDIVDDDRSSGRSMVLFSDNLISKEIRSNIAPISDDDDENYCRLRYRCGGSNSTIKTLSVCSEPSMSCSSDNRIKKNNRLNPPMGVVMVVDNEAPLMPLSRNQDNNDDDEMKDEDGAMMGLIHRTFSFDDQLPIIHRRRTASIRASLNKYLEEEEDDNDDDCYMEEQPSFTIPVTYSSDEGDRSMVLYPVSVPGTP